MQTKGKKIQFDTQYRGLHNLHTPSGAVSVNVIAVHGLAAHPLYTWVRKGVDKSWNWLEHQLVEFIPGARVWTFGYESNWLGDEAISTSHEDVAVALLDGLHDKSHHLFDQPLIFIAHSFGGIVLMKAFIRAENSRNWKNLFEHTEAILFFGTPFQGMNKWFTDDMPALAKLKYTQVQGLILDLMKEHNEALGELRQTFSGMVNTYQGPGIGCFYETKASNIQRIVEKLDLDKVADDKTDRIQLVIKDSAILERGPRRCERPLPCDHFDMNEFGEDDKNFNTVKYVLNDILSEQKRAAILHWGSCAESSSSTLPRPFTNAASRSSSINPETGDKPHQSVIDLSNWLEPALPSPFVEDIKGSFLVDAKKLPNEGFRSHSYSEAGLSPDCQSAFFLSDKEAEIYKDILEPLPNLRESIKRYDKLSWRCAAISNNFFVVANRKILALRDFRHSGKDNDFEPPGDIICLAIHERTIRSTGQEILVAELAVGLRNRETNVHEIRIYQINRSDWDLLRLIALDGTSLKMLSFSPDGALLACTVYGYDQQSNNGQYYERVMVHNVKDASPRDVCRISMNFIEVCAGRYPYLCCWLIKPLTLELLICTTSPDTSHREHSQWSCIAPVLINARHHPHRARHELNQFRLRTRARICTAAVAPRGNFIALLDTAGKLCFIPLQAGGLFGAKSADSKDCGISSNTSQPPIELPGFHLEQNLDSQQVSLRFDEVDGKLFAVDHRKQIRVVDFQKRVEPATSLNRKVSSFLSNQFHGKKHAG